MKKLLLIICTFVTLLFSGCSSTQNEYYVKNIKISKADENYMITFVGYDFTSDTEKLFEKSYISYDLYNLGVSAMNDGGFNLRLCENCFVSVELSFEINKVIQMLNSLHIPVSVNISFYTDSKFDSKKFESDKIFYSPLYNLNLNNGDVSGFISLIDSEGKQNSFLVVHSGEPAHVLDKKQSQIFNMLQNKKGKINYLFRDDTLSAEIDFLNCFYSINDSNLEINITVNLKNIIGHTSDNKEKIYDNMLKMDLVNQVTELIFDPVLNSVYNFHRLCDHAGIQCKETDVTVNIL